MDPNNRIIISADDYGLSPGVNLAIRELAGLGTISATNVMANMPVANEIEPVSRDLPDLSIGVHINLTQGMPVCSPHDVKSLVDETGSFYPKKQLVKRLLTGKVAYQDCRREITAQVRMLKDLLGDRVDHWNSHQGIHRFEPVASICIAVCREAGIGAMRSHQHRFLPPKYLAGTDDGMRLSARRPTGLSRMAKELYYSFMAWRASRHFALPDGLLTISTGSIPDILTLTTEMRLPDGIWEIPCHPATTVAQLTQTHLTESRVVEYQFLASPEFQQAVQDTPLILLNFCQLAQHRNRHKGADVRGGQAIDG